MSPHAAVALPNTTHGWAGALLTLAVVAVVMVTAALLAREYRRDRTGHNVHAHTDGTVHEHYRGALGHTHPTPLERYDRTLTRFLGPAPGTPASPGDQQAR